ncbi:hypothetical protein BWD162_012530 [Bartonella sp. WD16.2]|nr:hypothetical protein BWD162_012530 [Bartonella sp. WD16.2]
MKQQKKNAIHLTKVAILYKDITSHFYGLGSTILSLFEFTLHLILYVNLKF